MPLAPVGRLLAALAREIGCEPRALRAQPRPGDIRHSVADIRAARRLLGYQPQVDVVTGLQRTVEWYRERRAAGR